MKVLVTGGAGFIGSHFVLRHVEAYPTDTVVVLDALRHGSDRRHLALVEDRITFVRGDIVDVQLLTETVDAHGIDTIVNFAAETHVDRSITNAAPFLHSNVLGVQSIIEVCRARPAVRLLHVSTDEVYGDVDDADRSRTVEDILLPSSPYAASKAAGDLLIMAAMRTYGIHACVSRCTNNYGPHQADEKFIPTILRNALAGTPIPVYAKGENKRDWLYVTDHTDALELLLRTPWAFWDEKIGAGHFFNVSADAERRNIDVVRLVLSQLGAPETLISFVEDRPGHDWRYAVDSAPLRALGWAPQVPFEEGLRRTIDWFRSTHGATPR